MDALYIVLGIVLGLLFLVLLIHVVGTLVFIKFFIARQPYVELGAKKNESNQRKALVNSRRRVALDKMKELSYTTHEIRSFDGLKLKARLYPCKTHAKTLVIAFHGYTSNGPREYGDVMLEFLEKDTDWMLVSMRAHHESEGKYAGFGTLDRHDVKDWCDYAANNLEGYENIFIFGISMGAASVAMASGLELPKKVKGAIFDCGFSSAHDEFKHVMKDKAPFFPSKLLLAMMNAANNAFFGKYRFDTVTSAEEIKKATVPFLFFHGADDTFVPPYMSKEVYDACPTEKKYILTEGAEHAAAMYVDPNYVAEIDAFITKNSVADVDAVEQVLQ